MHIFLQILILYSGFILIGGLVIIRFVWLAESYPCEKCGLNPASRELVTGEELCESCFLLCKRDQRPADGSSEVAFQYPDRIPAVRGVFPPSPLSDLPQSTSAEDVGKGRLEHTLE